MALKNAPMACTVCHSSPGRLRVRVAGLRHSRQKAGLLQEWLAHHLRVGKAEARPATGSVVLFYDPGRATPGEILDLLRQALLLYRSNPVATLREQVPRESDSQSRSPRGSRFGRIAWLVALSLVGLYALVRRTFFRSPLPQGPLSLLGITVFLGAFPLLHRSRVVLKEKKPGMSLFPFLAGTCLLALLMGQALTALEVLWVTALSLLLEDSVAEKSRRQIREVLQVTVKDTLILVEGKEVRIPARRVQSGDTVVIYPGERIPVDGTVIQGEGLVDESHITGRSEPEFRSASHWAYAGTRLQQGKLYLRAEQVGEDTYLQRILRMVDESLANRAPAEQKADLLARRLVRLGFWATALTYVLTGQAFRAFTVLLVVACPCATALAASTAVAAALANAARHRCLIKGGLYLEEIGEADCFCFDKTGTLTSDIPRVVDVVPRVPGITPEKVLFLAAAAETQNPHPLARAIVEEAAGRGLFPSPPVSSEFVLGKGVRAEVEKNSVLVGNEGYMNDWGVDVAYFQKRARLLMESGHTVVYVARNGKVQGLIGVANPLRPGAAEVIDWLRRDGVRSLCLVSGDTEPVARQISLKLGLDDCRALLRPEEKSGHVEELQRRGCRVVMVGDGVNDALALARADIGIAMGAGGSEVAMEAADIALVDNDLTRLIRLRQLSRQTMRVVEQNHWLAVSTNVIGILLAASGRLSPLAAGLFHVVHTLGIMLNSRRLLGWKPPDLQEE